MQNSVSYSLRPSGASEGAVADAAPENPEGPNPSGLSRLQKKRKRMLFAAAAVLVPLAGMVAPRWVETGGVLRFDQLGALILTAAILGRCWCTLYIAAHKKRTLVTAGPYSLCRNPLYLFSFLAAAGAGLMSGSMSVGALFCLTTFALFQGVVVAEEKRLSEMFGASYQTYCARTPRWRPRFENWRDDGRLVTRPSLMLITLRDGACLFVFWPYFWLMETARDSGWLPVLLVLP